MIEDDINQLDERALDHPLDRLETDVWRGVATRARQRGAARRVTSFQGVLMVLALFGSVAVGINMAQPARAASSRMALSTGSELMPSNLLLGERP